MFTKGEWKVINEAERGIGKGFKVIPDNTVDGIYPFAAIITGENAYYDARLISAAPDLYQALKQIVDRYEQGLALGEKLDLEPARKALAKAGDN